LNNQKAFALPLVLVILAILTIMSVSLSRMSKAQVNLAAQQQQEWADERVIQNVFQELVVLLLTAKRTPGSLESNDISIPLDGRWVEYGGIQISLQDGNGLFLVQPSVKLWELLLKQYMDPRTANAVAARIVDWIDLDSIVTGNGMERAEYIAAGLQSLPRNGLLRGLDELLNIPGITPAVFNGNEAGDIRGLRELIILNVTSSGFNPATAPPEVLKVYGNLDDRQVAALIRAREQKNWEQVGLLFNEGQIGEGVELKAGLEFVLRFRTPSGLKARAAVRTTYSHLKPYEILYWYFPDYDRI
jgi:type II secretory pathway component PulK